MNDNVRRWSIRVLSGIAFFVAFALLIQIHPGCSGTTGHACPGYSFNDPVILRAERAVASLVIMLIVVALLVRLVLCGELPSGIGSGGVTWPEAQATDEAKAALGTLQDMVAKQGLAAELASDTTAVLLEDLTKRVVELEAEK